MDQTVLIVDDHADFRTSARALLTAGGWTVIGEAASGAEGLRLVEQLRPAVVLLDIALPDQDGFRVATALAREPDPPSVVLVSSRDARAYGRRIAEAPVRGFLPKQGLSGKALTDLLL
jgi:DNA-binding NarL/FixJ family response regulator